MVCSGCSALHGVNPNFKKKRYSQNEYMKIEDFKLELERPYNYIKQKELTLTEAV